MPEVTGDRGSAGLVQRAERERRSRRAPDSPATQLASCSDAWPGSSPEDQPAISAAMASGGSASPGIGSPGPGYSGRRAWIAGNTLVTGVGAANGPAPG